MSRKRGTILHPSRTLPPTPMELSPSSQSHLLSLPETHSLNPATALCQAIRIRAQAAHSHQRGSRQTLGPPHPHPHPQ